MATRAALEYTGGAAGLLPLLLIRTALWVAFAATLLVALRRSGLTQVSFLTALYEPDIALSLPLLWTITLGCLPFIAYVSSGILRYRWNRTIVYGQQVVYRPRFFARMGNLIVNVLLFGITAGLATPWIYSRNRRSFYRSCVVGKRARYALGFARSGPEMLWKCLLTLFYLPMVVLTLGLVRPFLSWLWIEWEHGSLLLPGRTGGAIKLRLTSGFWGYAGWTSMWWVFTVLSLGVLRPWALASEWRWIARHSEYR